MQPGNALRFGIKQGSSHGVAVVENHSKYGTLVTCCLCFCLCRTLARKSAARALFHSAGVLTAPGLVIVPRAEVPPPPKR